MNMEMIKNMALSPLTYVWENIYRARRFCYNYGLFKRNQFQVPIISVGNLAFGGTGKTPFTIWLSQYLLNLGVKPVVVMRGYKGLKENSGGLITSNNLFKYGATAYGDEALLIAKKLKTVPVIVGKKRSENLDFYFEQVSPDMVILDDGFQHLKLERNLNIVLFDAELPLSRYKVAPSGYLREGLTALKDAHIVIISRADQVDESSLDNLEKFLHKFCDKEIPFYRICYKAKGLFDQIDQLTYSVDQMKGQKVVAACGLASPESFFRTLQKLDVQICHKFKFPDHHSFSEEQIQDICQKADEIDAIVVMSEKDIVKLAKSNLTNKIYYLGIEIQFLKNEDSFKEKINNIVKLIK